MWRFMNHQPIKLANSQKIIVFRDNQDKENDGKVNTLPEWTAGSFLRSAQIEYRYLDLELLNQSTFHRKLQGTLTLKTSTVPVVQRTYVQFCCCRQTQVWVKLSRKSRFGDSQFWPFPVDQKMLQYATIIYNSNCGSSGILIWVWRSFVFGLTSGNSK